MATEEDFPPVGEMLVTEKISLDSSAPKKKKKSKPKKATVSLAEFKQVVGATDVLDTLPKESEPVAHDDYPAPDPGRRQFSRYDDQFGPRDNDPSRYEFHSKYARDSGSAPGGPQPGGMGPGRDDGRKSVREILAEERQRDHEAQPSSPKSGTRAARADPFGGARPREQVLKEKGLPVEKEPEPTQAAVEQVTEKMERMTVAAEPERAERAEQVERAPPARSQEGYEGRDGYGGPRRAAGGYGDAAGPRRDGYERRDGGDDRRPPPPREYERRDDGYGDRERDMQPSRADEASSWRSSGDRPWEPSSAAAFGGGRRRFDDRDRGYGGGGYGGRGYDERPPRGGFDERPPRGEYEGRGYGERSYGGGGYGRRYDERPPRGGGYEPPRGGYEPPRGGYEPPRGGYEPPRGGYEPPRGGYEPPRGGYEPPRGGYEPPRGEYRDDRYPPRRQYDDPARSPEYGGRSMPPPDREGAPAGESPSPRDDPRDAPRPREDN